MKTADVEVEWEGKMGIVKMRRLTFGEMNELVEQSSKIKYVGAIADVAINQKMLKELGLLKSIIDAPFQLNIQSIQALDMDDGNKLFDAWNELNHQGFQGKSS